METRSEAKPNAPLDLTAKWNGSIRIANDITIHRLQRALALGTIWDKVVEELHQTDPNLGPELLMRAAARSQGVKRIGWRLRNEIMNAIQRVIGQQ